MTYLINRKKLFLPGIILLVFFLTAMFISCRKNNETMQENSFNAPAAKEWFYGTFKKTNEYATAATAGKQLPGWKTGRYKKTGNMEMVEYDLVQQKKTALVTPTGNRFEDKRIAEATLNRALFVKQGNEIRLFNIQFIPGTDYAKTNGYDISKNTFTGPDKNFTGKLLIKNWNNELVKGYNITNGKKTSVIKQILKENPASRTGINPDCYYSYTAWFEQDCTTTPVGDNIAIENCSEWQMMWENITETYCPVGPSECSLLGLDEEACMCQMLGICNGGGGEEDDEACNQFIEECNEQVAIEVEPASVTAPDNAFTRDTTIKWVVGGHKHSTWRVVAFTNFVTDGYVIGGQHHTHIQTVKTLSTAYEGSNAIVETTWTQKSITDNILVNNSPNARTKSTVTGDLKHVCKRFPHPACLWLRDAESLSNSMEVTF